MISRRDVKNESCEFFLMLMYADTKVKLTFFYAVV